uniref:Fibrinogen C-terminal domain-containing protein n=1 Tax=Heterorhabditis bacteriophora TaxID=37862 RepID=A0A1I7WF75_HETBA
MTEEYKGHTINQQMDHALPDSDQNKNERNTDGWWCGFLAQTVLGIQTGSTHNVEFTELALQRYKHHV